MHRNRLIASIALGLVISVAALGEEKTIKQSKLPPAVQRPPRSTPPARP